MVRRKSNSLRNLVDQDTDSAKQVGAETYRDLRQKGLTALPGSTVLPTGRSITVPSRDAGRTIPCRLLAPQVVDLSRRGIFLHIHGGGWVLNDEASSDIYLQTIADSCGLLCLSVGYRLAPEDPYPAGPDDCEDVALWLIANAEHQFGRTLSFIGGESAGANLAVAVALRLLNSEARLNLDLKGLLLHYGVYSLNWLPGTSLYRKSPTLVLDETTMNHFREAYCPGMTAEQLSSPDISPFYADLANVNLPPALFTSGSEDCLVEDSVFMCTRWTMAGHKAILKIYPGSPHGYIHFRADVHENVPLAMSDLKDFVDMVDRRTVRPFTGRNGFKMNGNITEVTVVCD